MSATLADAYAAARYCIDCAGMTIERRIGKTDAHADRLLADAGCRQYWHVLTPCNPRSRRLPDTENTARLGRLRTQLEALPWRVLPACNRADDGSWQEPGVCVLDAPADRVLALAHEYGQLAIVAGTLGGAPRLVWVDDPSSQDSARRGQGR